KAGLAVHQWRPVLDFPHAAAGGGDDGMARGGVPFHRAAVARVDIGLTPGDETELDRASGQDLFRHAVMLQEPIELDAGAIGAAESYGYAVRIDATGGDRAPFAVLLHEGAAGYRAGIEQVARGRVDDAQHRLA